MMDKSALDCLAKPELTGSDYVRLVSWVNARAQQCAELAAAGKGRLAIITAETTPSMETLMETLQQNEPEEWGKICSTEGILLPPTINEEPLAILEQLSEVILPPEHALYRHYRTAMVKQDPRAALHALRQMADIAPCDPNVIEELTRTESQLKETTPTPPPLPPFPASPSTPEKSETTSSTEPKSSEIRKAEAPGELGIEIAEDKTPSSGSRRWIVATAVTVIILGAGISLASWLATKDEPIGQTASVLQNPSEEIAQTLSGKGFKNVTQTELITIAATKPKIAQDVALFAVRLIETAELGNLEKFVGLKPNPQWEKEAIKFPTEISDLKNLADALEKISSQSSKPGTITQAWSSYLDSGQETSAMRRNLEKWPKLREQIESKLVATLFGSIQPSNVNPSDPGSWSSWLSRPEEMDRLRTLSATWTKVVEAKSAEHVPDVTAPQWLVILAGQRKTALKTEAEKIISSKRAEDIEKNSRYWVLSTDDKPSADVLLIGGTKDDITWSRITKGSETPIFGLMLMLAERRLPPFLAQEFNGEVLKEKMTALDFGTTIRCNFRGADTASLLEFTFSDSEREGRNPYPQIPALFAPIKPMPGFYSQPAVMKSAVQWKANSLIISTTAVRFSKGFNPPKGGAILLALPFELPTSPTGTIQIPETGIIDFSDTVAQLKSQAFGNSSEGTRLDEIGKRKMELYAALKRKENYLREKHGGDKNSLNDDLAKLNAWSSEATEIELLNEELKTLSTSANAKKKNSSNHPLLTNLRAGNYSIVVQLPNGDLALELLRMPLTN